MNRIFFVQVVQLSLMKHKREPGGFITLVIVLLAVLVGAVVVAFVRVKARQ